MTVDEFENLLDSGILKIGQTVVSNEDPVLVGLNIIAKYFPHQCVVINAGKRKVISVKVKDLVQAGITETDAKILDRLGWYTDESENEEGESYRYLLIYINVPY